MNKQIIALCVGVVIIIAAVGIAKNNSTQDDGEKPIVKIGLSLPLSGPLAFLGEPAKKSAELALKDAGKTKYNYQLVFEDDQFDAKKAASSASKLVNTDKVLALISFGSGTGNVINSIAENGKTAQFALASDPTIAKGQYNYVHWTPPFKEGALLAEQIISRGYKKVSIVDTNHPGALAVTKSIKDALAGTDVQIVSYDLTNVGERDFKTIITKIKTADPDIIVLEMFSPEIEIIAKQMKVLQLNTQTTSVESFEWTGEPKLFEGAWFVSDSVVPDFSAKYKKEYGKDPASGSSYVYDIISLLITLQEKSGTVIQPQDLPAAITAMHEWNSPVFGKIKIDADGFFLTDAALKMIKDGVVVPVK